MKSKNIVFGSLALLIALTQFSCVEDVPVSEITNVPFDVESISSPNITTSEINTTYTVDFTLDEGQIVNTLIDITLDEVNTTATNGVDFNFTPTTVEIPAYVRNGSFSFDILEDLTAEGTEQIKFLIEPHDAPFSIGSSHEVNVTIQDSVYSTLNLVFDWSGTFEFSGNTFDICPNLDMDIYVMDAAGTDLGIYDAATGACPEILVMDPDVLDDGSYFLMSQMYNNELDGYSLNIDFPITVTATKGGVFTNTFVPVEIWNSDEDDAVHGEVYNFKPVVEVVLSGETFTLKDLSGDIIVSGFRGPKSDR